jgi:hypothetical protein
VADTADRFTVFSAAAVAGILTGAAAGSLGAQPACEAGECAPLMRWRGRREGAGKPCAPAEPRRAGACVDEERRSCGK